MCSLGFICTRGYLKKKREIVDCGPISKTTGKPLYNIQTHNCAVLEHTEVFRGDADDF